MHVTGFQLPHLVGDNPLGPFKATTIAAPPTLVKSTMTRRNIMSDASASRMKPIAAPAQFDEFFGIHNMAKFPI